MFNIPNGLIYSDPGSTGAIIINGPIFKGPLHMGNQPLGQHSKVGPCYEPDKL